MSSFPHRLSRDGYSSPSSASSSSSLPSIKPPIASSSSPYLDSQSAINATRAQKMKSHRNSIAQYIDTERRHKAEHQMFLQQKLHSKPTTESLDSQTLIYLPRGGTIVQTPSGPIQFGMPPETIKDSMKLGITLPVHFVVPKERFNLQLGINVAEFEFPAYYNFFFKRRRINLIVTREVEPLIRTIFQQTLLGPSDIPIPDEYGPSCPKDCYPDLTKEMSFFRVNPFDKTPLTVDSLLQFSYFEDGVCKLDNGIEIHDEGEEYVVFYNSRPDADGNANNGFATANGTPSSPSPSPSPTSPQSPSSNVSNSSFSHSSSSSFTVRRELCHVPCEVILAPLSVEEKQENLSLNYFVPPEFGVTMLGNSDGFDMNGTTTGFVLWMNRRGIMVDPPPHSSALLKRHGISPRLMRGVILTHCHADHDAGTFQKILEEGKVVVITSEIIMNSFITKYVAISGLEESFLRKLFVFRPAIIGQKIAVYGGHVEFFYSLHSIPCVGFAAYCSAKSMVYSADSFNDRAGIQKFYEMGLMSAGRRDKLMNFQWHHDLILHEAGVPPIHTPMATFDHLADAVKERLYIVHKPTKDVPKPLKSALVGPENTIVISHSQCENSTALEVLDLLGSIEMFSSFVISKGLEIVQCANYLKFHKGDVLIEEGTYGSTLFVICMGIVSITQGDVFLKYLTVGDHFGEYGMVSNERRTATIRAETEVEVIQFNKADFMHIVRNTNAIERLKQLGIMQKTMSWGVISANSVFATMTASQKTYLQSLLQRKTTKPNETLWLTGGEASEAYLVAEGQYVFSRAQDMSPFTKGAFIGDMRALLQNNPLSTTLICTQGGSVYYIVKKDLLKFLDDNPGVKVQFLNRRFIE